MLLNPYLYKDPEDKIVSDESIKRAGIVYNKRKIYILKKYAMKCFSADSIFNSYLMNTVILVNVSKSKIDENLYRCIKSTYSFTYTGTNGDVISEFRNARMKLNYCITSGYDCDSTYEEGKFVDSMYYEDLGFTFGYDENEDPVEVNINDMMCSGCDESSPEAESEKLIIPDPRYYTIKQYELDDNEEYDFIMNRNRYYDANDLIDSSTDIYVVEENELDKMNCTHCVDKKGDIIPAKGEVIFELAERISDIQSIPFDMFVLNCKACFTSYKFIYDSKFGFNIKDINTDKNIIRSRNMDYLELIADKMKKYCEKIKKNYGDFRLYYYSSDISDRIEIILDDPRFHKICSTFDKNSMFERLMVFVTDKYESYLRRPTVNFSNLNFDNYFAI